MSEENDLIRELEKLKASSASSARVDATVDNKVNLDKRLRLVQSLQLILVKLKRDLAVGSQTTLEKPLVRSHLSILPPHNLTQEMEFTSARFTLPLIVGESKDLNVVDNQYDRTLFFDEFSNRFDILTTRIIGGNLDDLLSFPPEILIHGIMGQSGELLGRLEIDPKAGETYALFEKEINIKKLLTPVKKDLGTPRIQTAQEIADAISRSAQPRVQELPKVTPMPVPSELGIATHPLNDEIRSLMELEKGTQGLLVIKVFKHSPAEEAGLIEGTIPTTFESMRVMLRGDIIVGIEDRPITNANELKDYLDHYHVKGKGIKLNVLRMGKMIETSLNY